MNTDKIYYRKDILYKFWYFMSGHDEKYAHFMRAFSGINLIMIVIIIILGVWG